MTETVIIKKGYLIKMSIGFDLRIDQDELPQAIAIWKSGDIGKFKQGMIKGNYIAGIIEDGERAMIERDFNPNTGKRYDRVRLLADVFKDTNLTDKKLLK